MCTGMCTVHRVHFVCTLFGRKIMTALVLTSNVIIWLPHRCRSIPCPVTQVNSI